VGRSRDANPTRCACRLDRCLHDARWQAEPDPCCGLNLFVELAGAAPSVIARLPVWPRSRGPTPATRRPPGALDDRASSHPRRVPLDSHLVCNEVCSEFRRARDLANVFLVLPALSGSFAPFFASFAMMARVQPDRGRRPFCGRSRPRWAGRLFIPNSDPGWRSAPFCRSAGYAACRGARGP